MHLVAPALLGLPYSLQSKNKTPHEGKEPVYHERILMETNNRRKSVRMGAEGRDKREEKSNVNGECEREVGTE